MYRSFSRCLAASVLLAFALPACGGNTHATPEAPQGKSQAAAQAAAIPGLKIPIPTGAIIQKGTKSKLLVGLSQFNLTADRNRRAGKGGVLPFIGGVGGGLIHHIIKKSPLSLSEKITLGSRSELGIAWTPGNASALVLFDTAGQWGFLGELYGMSIANLSGHFGNVDTEPISSYVQGQVNQYTATFYVGSDYYTQTTDGIPQAFYTDVAASTRPVVWIGDNIWNFAASIGVTAFENKYGWNPANSYFGNAQGNAGNVTQVTYKNQSLTRSIPASYDSGILHPAILGGASPPVTTLAVALDASTSPATQFPWAIRSANLTYIGEIPFDFTDETDRYIAFEDLLFDALAPTTTTRHRAIFRLEDLNASDDQTQLMTIAQYLYTNKIPYGFNIIPHYKDPLGAYHNGVATDIPLNSLAAASFVSTIKYMTTHGGTPIDEGWTHQYSNIDNPYTGVSGDDTEFFRAHIDASNNVVWDGPVSEDSTAWAQGRVNSSIAEYASVKLSPPVYWVTSHYVASDVDYAAVATAYTARYERSLYFAGTIAPPYVTNYTQYTGQFYPYTIQDVYGTTVLPENLGDYEPTSFNNHPARLAADIIKEAQLNLAVRDGYASFFYDPTNGTTPLGQILAGIKGLGYTFVATGQ